MLWRGTTAIQRPAQVATATELANPPASPSNQLFTTIGDDSFIPSDAGPGSAPKWMSGRSPSQREVIREPGRTGPALRAWGRSRSPGVHRAPGLSFANRCVRRNPAAFTIEPEEAWAARSPRGSSRASDQKEEQDAAEEAAVNGDEEERARQQ